MKAPAKSDFLDNFFVIRITCAWFRPIPLPHPDNPKANESSKAEKPLDQVYDSLDEKICDGKKMSKNMY